MSVTFSFAEGERSELSTNGKECEVEGSEPELTKRPPTRLLHSRGLLLCPSHFRSFVEGERSELSTNGKKCEVEGSEPELTKHPPPRLLHSKGLLLRLSHFCSLKASEASPQQTREASPLNN